MADQATLDKYTKAATRFRQMIEEADWSNLTIEFEKFPECSCGDASTLLAQYLIDAGYDTPTYVSGEIVEPTRLLSHAWIELDDIVLDITADGIDPNLPKVIVTDNSAWHDQFDRLDEHPVAIDMYEDHVTSRLSAAYEEIIGSRVH